MKIRCPHCRATLTLPHELGDGPTPLDVVVCAFCAEILIFAEDLSIRIAGPEDFSEMSEELRTMTEHAIRHARTTQRIQLQRINRHYVN